MVYISFDFELFMLTCNGNVTKIEGHLVILYKTILKCSSHEMEYSNCICRTVLENMFKYYGCIRVYRPAANEDNHLFFSYCFYKAGPVVQNFVT